MNCITALRFLQVRTHVDILDWKGVLSNLLLLCAYTVKYIPYNKCQIRETSSIYNGSLITVIISPFNLGPTAKHIGLLVLFSPQTHCTYSFNNNSVALHLIKNIILKIVTRPMVTKTHYFTINTDGNKLMLVSEAIQNNWNLIQLQQKL